MINRSLPLLFYIGIFFLFNMAILPSLFALDTENTEEGNDIDSMEITMEEEQEPQSSGQDHRLDGQSHFSFDYATASRIELLEEILHLSRALRKEKESHRQTLYQLKTASHHIDWQTLIIEDLYTSNQHLNAHNRDLQS